MFHKVLELGAGRADVVGHKLKAQLQHARQRSKISISSDDIMISSKPSPQHKGRSVLRVRDQLQTCHQLQGSCHAGQPQMLQGKSTVLLYLASRASRRVLRSVRKGRCNCGYSIRATPGTRRQGPAHPPKYLQHDNNVCDQAIIHHTMVGNQ